MSPSKIDDLKRDLNQLTAPPRAEAPRAGRRPWQRCRASRTHTEHRLARRTWRVWGEISDANIFLIAGGVTYAILLALFPGLAAAVSVYGSKWARLLRNPPKRVTWSNSRFFIGAINDMCAARRRVSATHSCLWL